MKKILSSLFFVFVAIQVNAADVVVFSTTTNNVLSFRKSVDTVRFQGRSDVVINPDLSALVGVPIKYWKHSAGSILEMTTGEKSAVDAQEIVDFINAVRVDSKAQLQGFRGSPLMMRAVLDIIRNEINILRAQHGLADRTLDQLKTSVNNKIDSGDVD